jgi:hypothetical protein
MLETCLPILFIGQFLPFGQFIQAIAQELEEKGMHRPKRREENQILREIMKLNREAGLARTRYFFSISFICISFICIIKVVNETHCSVFC